MEPEIKKITTNYDGIAKSLLDSMKDESLVAFINSSFSKNLKKTQKLSDSLLKLMTRNLNRNAVIISFVLKMTCS